MAIRVEFYGIARQRAGRSEVTVCLPEAQATLRDVLTTLSIAVPNLSGELLSNGHLHESLTANLDGTCFVSDSATLIRDGQNLLILSADAGG